MRILCAMLGGTIASSDVSGTITLGQQSFVKDFLLEYSADNEYFFPDLEIYSSEDATPEMYREALKEIVIESRKTKFDGILITHGTDTCAIFAQLAYRVLSILGIPFVITGAIKSPDKDPEESAYNLLFAIGCIEKGTSGVVFRNSDRIPCLYKAYAITSPDLDGIYKECKDCVEPEIKDRIDFLTRDKLPRVLVIPAFPGAVIPEDGFDRVLLCCNHSGTASAKLVPLVSKWTSEGKKVFMAPIPKKGGYYESRKKLVEAGAIELPGMPIEGAWCEALLR